MTRRRVVLALVGAWLLVAAAPRVEHGHGSAVPPVDATCAVVAPRTCVPVGPSDVGR
jgi:hypothetical protein